MLAVRVLLLTLIISSVVGFFPIKPIFEHFERHTAIVERHISTRAPLDYCNTIACRTVGQSCTGNYTAVPPAGYTCTSSYCSDPTGLNSTATCLPLLANGAACQNPLQCALYSTCNATIDGTGGICIGVLNNEPAGGICNTNSDCQYATSSCANGVCNGVALGGTCASGNSDECNPPNVCSGNTCVAPIAGGGACEIDNDNCDPYNYCIPSAIGSTAGTCVPIGTAKIGSLCRDQTDCPDTSGCYTVNIGDPVGTCTTAPTTGAGSGASCSSYPANSSLCLQYETCQCNNNNGENGCYYSFYPNPPGYSTIIQQLYTCVTQKCNVASAACVFGTCLNPYCALVDTLKDAQYQFLTTQYPKCLIDYYFTIIPQLTGCTGATTAGTTGTSDTYTLAAGSSAAALAAMLASLLV